MESSRRPAGPRLFAVRAGRINGEQTTMEKHTASGDLGGLISAIERRGRAEVEIAERSERLLCLFEEDEPRFFRVGPSYDEKTVKVTRTGDSLFVEATALESPYGLEYPEPPEVEELAREAAAVEQVAREAEEKADIPFVEVGFPHPDSAEAAEFAATEVKDPRIGTGFFYTPPESDG